MSVQRLHHQLESLHTTPRLSQDEIKELRQAAGPKVSQAERTLVDQFVRMHRSDFDDAALQQLCKSFDLQLPQSARLQIVEEVKIDPKEASGIVRTSHGWMIADDDKGIFFQPTEGEAERLLGPKDKAARGIEGLCLSTDGKTAYTLSEDSRSVFAFPLSQSSKNKTPKLGEAERLGRLPRLGDVKNKGWEGIDILPARFSLDRQERLVAIHEGNPRQIGIFDLPDLSSSHLLKLPDTLKEHMKDISDIAICPQTGHLFLLSDESKCVAELAIKAQHHSAPGALFERIELELLGHTTLAIPKDAKPEGMSFDGAGTLWIVSDGDQRLWKLDVTR